MPLKNIVTIAVAIIVALTCYNAVSKNRYANLYAEAMEIIEREALLKSDKRDLFDASMQGMLKDFGPHSRFFSGRMFKSINESLRQRFGGVGMYIDVDPETKETIVLAPMPHSPASEAGLLPGDIIQAIDGTLISSADRQQPLDLLRGEEGTSVSVIIKRGDKILNITIVRREIQVDSIHGDWLSVDGKWEYVLKDYPQIGYVRLSEFGDRTTEEFIADLKPIAEKIDGLIIDLRNNGGGLLKSAVDICDQFLPVGKLIVETRGRKKQVEEQHYSTATELMSPSVPIVILIDRNSASASEIVAACLQDHNRAIIIGERSYGKGTVQNLITLEPNVSAIKLTTASYWRPSGKNIDRESSEQNANKEWGVTPDPAFEIEMSEREVFENYRRRHLRDLQGIHEANGYVSKSLALSQPVANEQNTTVSEPKPDDGEPAEKYPSPLSYTDRPLQRAIEVLLSK